MSTRDLQDLSAQSQRKVLPPLDYLIAFEASADAMGFAGASRVLNISETAISRKVRLLELHFGLSFFTRSHRSITLTPQGQEFLDRIRPALDSLRETSGDLLDAGRNRPVVLAATNSVSALWLTPRMHQFREDNTHVNITLVASDNDDECLAETVDLAILRGDGKWPGYTSQLVFGETVFPVCSPEYLERHPEIAEPENLPAAALIEVASHHSEWMNWRDWFTASGIAAGRLGRSATFNTYHLSIYAALDGVGVALGWGHLVDRLLESGRLVRPLGEAHVRTDFGYYLLTPNSRPVMPAADEVAAWLMEISARRKRYG